MEVTLMVTKGKSAGRVVPVTGPKFFIGRAPDCHLRPSSDLIGRHHCVILVGEEILAVRDFGSQTGTRVNNQRVRGQQALKAGDRLTVGPLEFEVRTDLDIGGKTKAKVESFPTAAVRTVESVDDMDVTELWGDAYAPPAAEPDEEMKTVESPVARAEVAKQATQQAPEGFQTGPFTEISEKEKDARRRQSAIVGVSKSAQARRTSETPQDAAMDALWRFFTRAR